MVKHGDLTACPVSVVAERDQQLQTKTRDLVSAFPTEIELAIRDGGLWNKAYGHR